MSRSFINPLKGRWQHLTRQQPRTDAEILPSGVVLVVLLTRRFTVVGSDWLSLGGRCLCNYCLWMVLDGGVVFFAAVNAWGSQEVELVSFVVVVSWLLLFQENAHGLRDRLGGRSFKPRVLSFFFLRQDVGSGAMASPSSVCLGCCSVCSSFCFSYLSCFRLSCLPFSVVFVFSSSSSGRRCAVFLSCFSCSCLLLVLMSWGGFSGVGGYVCCGVCVSSSASPCFKESPRGAPLCMPCLLLILVVPSSCFLSIWFLLCCACLFLMHVHAQRRRPLGLGLLASCVAALLSQDPRRSGPLDLPCLGSWYSKHG